MKKTIILLAVLTLVVAATSCVEEDAAERGDGQPGDPCEGTIDCTPGSICWNQICVQEGVLRFSVSWTVANDVDLHVLTPNGNEIYYANSFADGGELDVDDCVGGGCTNPDGTHVENVFFTEEAAPGTYTYWVVNFSGSEDAAFEIEVAEGEDIVASDSGTVSPAVATSEMFTYTF